MWIYAFTIIQRCTILDIGGILCSAFLLEAICITLNHTVHFSCHVFSRLFLLCVRFVFLILLELGVSWGLKVQKQTVQ